MWGTGKRITKFWTHLNHILNKGYLQKPEWEIGDRNEGNDGNAGNQGGSNENAGNHGDHGIA